MALPSDRAVAASPPSPSVSSLRASIPSAGEVYVQNNIPFTRETSYDWVGEGFSARQEPMHEFWQIGERETQYGSEYDGLGRFEVRVLEVVQTAVSGPVAIYERHWFTPDGEPLCKPRKRYSRVANLKALISRRKMTAQGIEAGTGETEGLGAKRESPVGNADAPQTPPVASSPNGLTQHSESADASSGNGEQAK